MSTAKVSPVPQPEGAGDSLRHQLRVATRAEHESLDQRLSAFDLRHLPDYRAFLGIHRVALTDIAALCRPYDQDDIAGLARSLDADLLACGALPVATRPAHQAAVDACGQWGGAYVIRGSRLGAQLFARQVPADYPRAYLDHVCTLAWPDFLRQLEADPGNRGPEAPRRIIHGARLAFAAFAAAVPVR